MAVLLLSIACLGIALHVAVGGSGGGSGGSATVLVPAAEQPAVFVSMEEYAFESRVVGTGYVEEPVPDQVAPDAEYVEETTPDESPSAVVYDSGWTPDDPPTDDGATSEWIPEDTQTQTSTHDTSSDADPADAEPG